MYTSAEPITGTIARVEGHGTVVLVWVEREDGTEATIPFDYTPFRWLLEGEGIGVNDLIGREIGFDGEVVWFGDFP